MGSWLQQRKVAKNSGGNARDFLEQEFYVDHGLKSFANPEEAIATVKNAQAICASANLRLHKFASNNKVVLESISKEDCANDLKDLDLRHDALPIQLPWEPTGALSPILWDSEIQLKDKPCTRRGMLSTVCSVYDPLGIVAPVILIGRQILQDLCRDNYGWDDPVPNELLSRWEKFSHGKGTRGFLEVDVNTQDGTHSGSNISECFEHAPQRVEL